MERIIIDLHDLPYWLAFPILMEMNISLIENQEHFLLPYWLAVPMTIERAIVDQHDLSY